MSIFLALHLADQTDRGRILATCRDPDALTVFRRSVLSAARAEVDTASTKVERAIAQARLDQLLRTFEAVEVADAAAV